MEISPNIVNWEMVTRLKNESRLEKALRSDEVDDIYKGAPWKWNSSLLYFEVAECYKLIKSKLSEPTRSNADMIMSSLINENYYFPQDIGTDIDVELVAGSHSPNTIHELLKFFENINYTHLDNAYDSCLSMIKEKKLVIANGKFEGIFTDYIRQWQRLLKHAKNKNRGIFIYYG